MQHAAPVLDGALDGDGHHVEPKQAIQLVGRELVLKAIGRIDRRAAIVGAGFVGRDLLEHGPQLDAVLAQGDLVRLGDPGVDVFDVQNLGIHQPLLERVVVEAGRTRPHGTRRYFGLKALAGPIGVDHAPLPVLEHQRRRRAVIGGLEHPGVEEDHLTVEAAVHLAVLRWRVTGDDPHYSEGAQRRVQVVRFRERIAQRLAAVPHWGVAREELLLQLRQHFRLRFGSFGSLGREHRGPLIKGWRTHDFELLLECRPRIRVLGEEREHLVIGAEPELRDHRRQTSMHERRVVDDEHEGLPEQPRTVLPRGRKGLAMREITARELRVELRAHCGRLLAQQPRPRLLAQRVVFLSGEGRVLLGRNVAQIAHDIHDFVVTEHHVYRAAGFPCLNLEAHQQIEHLPGCRSAIEQIARADQMGGAGTPVQIRIDYLGFTQHRQQLVVGSVHIRESHDALCAGNARLHGRPRATGHQKQKRADRRNAHEGALKNA